MNFPKYALEHKPIVLGLALLLLLWGINTFLTAPRAENPSFIIRDALVITDWPGATAQQIENLITDKIEKVAADIKFTRRVQSWSYAGRSVVQVTATEDVTDIQKVWTKLRADLELIIAELPNGASPPIVDDNFGDTAALILALYQDPETAKTQPYSPKELEDFAKRLRDKLMDIRPTTVDEYGRKVPISDKPSLLAKVNLYGVQPEVIYLETDAGTWSQLQITSSELQNILSQRNVVATGGVLNTDRYRINTHIKGSFNAETEINNVIVGRVSTESSTAILDNDSSQYFSNIEKANQKNTSASSYDVPVKLDNLKLNVKREYQDPPPAIVRYANSDDISKAIVISFTMKPGQNISVLGDAVNEVLESANQTILPPDIRIEKVSNPPKFVEEKVQGVLSNLVQAIVLVLLILGAMAGLRVALVTAATIPLIMLTSVALMRIWNIEIEQISLAALIVALGLLVDNAIVTCENTTNFLNKGLPKKEAVIEGCNSVGMSLLWSSLTTISVFIPMTFALTGSTREYIYSLPVVVTLTLLVSWLCAMTIAPILNYYILKPTNGSLPIVNLFTWFKSKLGFASSKKTTTSSSAKKGLFAALSLKAISLRFLTISIAFTLLLGSILLPIKSSFFPNSARNQFIVDIWLPETASIYRTNEVSKQVEKIIQKLSEVSWVDGEWKEVVDKDGNTIKRLSNIVSYTGIGGPRFYTSLNPLNDVPHYANIIINTTNANNVSKFVEDIRRAAWAGIGNESDSDYLAPVTGARVVPHRLVLGTPVTSPIQYRINGPRLGSDEILRDAGEKIKTILSESELAWDINDSWGAYGMQMDVDVKSAHANLAGVTNKSIARTLNSYYSGLELTRFREEDSETPVKLRLPAEQRHSIHAINAAFVEGYDQKVPLNSVAEVSLEHSPTVLTRFQREKSLWVQARPEINVLASEVIEQLKPKINAIKKQLPIGYHIQDGGIQEAAGDGNRQNTASLSIGILLVIACLVFQYNSAIKPMLILLTVPLSIIGGLLGLWMRGISLGFMETLGFLALFGTVLNAAILLIDYAEQLIKEKLANKQGLSEAGEKSYCGLTRDAFRSCLISASEARMMPIMMTTATTVAGLASLMFAGGPLFKGLATVFATGLVVGSVITLFVLPALMSLFVENFRYSMVDEDQ